ncbi:FAD-binding protein [Pantoea vagans]|nr:FAD-binding protein [Pantoea vagans]
MSNQIATAFPLKTFRTDFLNWSKETSGKNILSCSPKTSAELLDVINWAVDNKFKVRPVGIQHNWSRLTIDNNADNSDVVLVDMTKHLNAATIVKHGDYGYVTAQTGIQMEALVTLLEKKKLGFYSMPAPGDLTLGGVLAIGGHGTGIPSVNEERPAGGSWGTVSNNIVELKAIVWDDNLKLYVLKTFERTNPEISAFMIHVGRAFIYEVKLQVPRNKRLRCQSFVNVPAVELFGQEGEGIRTYTSYLDKCGRAEIIWFPFTTTPWLKIWTESPAYNRISKPVHSPFNYPFSDNIPVQVSDLVRKIHNGFPELTPSLGNLMFNLVNIGLGATISSDLWGWSKDVLMYIKPDTLRVTANGYVIITRRENIQKVLSEFKAKYESMVDIYKKSNAYPMNGPIEIRVTGLDNPADSDIAGAVPPALSAARPVDAHPEWDVAIWLDNLTMPGTPDSLNFFRELEKWVFNHYSGDYATVRVEWSKGWGYSEKDAWDNETVIDTLIPDSLTQGITDGYDWRFAKATLDKYDPHYLYSSPLTRRLFKATL